jgi:transcriptional regulator with XRE-family HTH domain
MVVSSDSSFLIALGNRIRECRKKLGVSQQELAYRIGMEKSNLSVIESGKSNPQVLTLIKISCALDIQPSELFSIHIETNAFMENPMIYTPRKHKK